MNMRRGAVAGLLALLVSAAVLAEDKPDYAKLLVGKWEATKTDPGTLPVGAVVEFTKDGKMSFAVKEGESEFKIEGTYKVEGNVFTMTLKLGDDEKSQKITIKKLDDKVLETTDEKSNAADFKRVK
jgi:uncharacterized protein (TIGR03066 family)